MEVAAEQSVLLELAPPAARITLNRPDKRNALSLEVMGEVTEALRSASHEQDVRAIVIAGAGPAFSAGHDLGEMVGRDLAFYQRLFDACTVMMEAIHKVPQPVIAKVHGSGVRGRLPARRRLRPRRRRRGDAVRHPRREDRPLLFDADGSGVAGGRAQARARAPAHRASRSTPPLRPTGGSSTASSRTTSSTRRSTAWSTRSPARARSRSGSGRKPSTRRSSWTNRARTT